MQRRSRHAFQRGRAGAAPFLTGHASFGCVMLCAPRSSGIRGRGALKFWAKSRECLAREMSAVHCVRRICRDDSPPR